MMTLWCIFASHQELYLGPADTGRSLEELALEAQSQATGYPQLDLTVLEGRRRWDTEKQRTVYNLNQVASPSP